MSTTVGVSVLTHGARGERAQVSPEAYCESMCVFVLLSGKSRYVPQQARVRVHQIWMGDRAENARAASYSADDLTIVERDIGRLAKYTFDMGGAGDLLALSLNNLSRQRCVRPTSRCRSWPPSTRRCAGSAARRARVPATSAPAGRRRRKVAALSRHPN
jgi:hypothetical protein